MDNKSVGIVDYVGKKGGNHYYSLCLLNALAKHGYSTYLYSNFTEKINDEDITIRKVFRFDIKSNVKGLINLLFGTLRACIGAQIETRKYDHLSLV